MKSKGNNGKYHWLVEKIHDGYHAVVIGPGGGQLYRVWHSSKLDAKNMCQRIKEEYNDQ